MDSVRRVGWRKAGGKVLAFMNPPMWGGLTAVLAGLIPFARHGLFDQGGWLKPFSESVVRCQSLSTRTARRLCFS